MNDEHKNGYKEYGKFLSLPPTWDRADENAPAFLNRTETKYWRGPLATLNDRGIENRLLDSLVSALPDGTVIAGGFMTAVVAESKDAQDIDLFFTSPKAFLKAYKTILDADELDEDAWALKGYDLDPKTLPNVTEALESGNFSDAALRDVRFIKFVHPKRLPIQLLKLAWYDNAEHVIDSFDLTIAQFAVDVQKSELVANPTSFLDLARKRIVLHRMQFPSSTLRRVIKYSKKGYYACPGSLEKISAEIAANIEKDQPKFVYVD